MSHHLSKSKIELLKDLYKDPDRKPIYKMVTELLSLGQYHRDIPRHYFSRFLFKKNITNIKDYFPDKFLGANIKLYFNDYSIKEVLENKLFFDLFYSQFNIKLPQVLMYNHQNIFILEKQRYEIDSVLDFKGLLKNVFNKNPILESMIIKKTYGSYGGDKIYKFDRSQLITDDLYDITKIYTEIKKTGFLFQETIKQHTELNKLNPSCLNTIRFDTFIDKNGNIDIISSYLRMSINNSYVDNASQGGCFVGINLSNGKLKKMGFTNFSQSGVELLTSHPVTKVKFENFRIPFFEKAKDLVLQAAGYIPGLRLIGWDVGIGESGPILIEGNTWYMARGNDMTVGGYRSNPIFKKLLLEFQENKIRL